MIIRAIEVKKFRNLHERSFSFMSPVVEQSWPERHSVHSATGANIKVCGNNGSGKSSFLDLLEICLNQRKTREPIDATITFEYGKTNFELRRKGKKTSVTEVGGKEEVDFPLLRCERVGSDPDVTIRHFISQYVLLSREHVEKTKELFLKFEEKFELRGAIQNLKKECESTRRMVAVLIDVINMARDQMEMTFTLEFDKLGLSAGRALMFQHFLKSEFPEQFFTTHLDWQASAPRWEIVDLYNFHNR